MPNVARSEPMPVQPQAVQHDETDRDQSRKGNGPFRFAGWIMVFFAPLLLLTGVLEILLWNAGETLPIERVIQAQQSRPGTLFMRGILDQGFYRYKSLQVSQRKPKILVLGSSRVMEFRSEMFGNRGRDFFNGGGLIQDLSDLKSFVRRIETENAPELIILGLDAWWFNGNKPPLNGLSSGMNRDAALDWQEHVRAWRRFKSSKARKVIAAARRATNENIGIEARSASVGFRLDGSMQYNFAPAAASNGWRFVDRETPPISERIRNSTAQFTPCSGASADRLEILAACLDELARKNVLVAGFLPPISSEAAGLLERSATQSNLWNEVRARLPKLFRERSLMFGDASLLRDLGLNDSFMIDGIHAAETFHLHLLESFLADERVAAILPGLSPKIRAALSSPEANPWEPDYTPLLSP